MCQSVRISRGLPPSARALASSGVAPHRRRTSPATYNVQRIVRQVPVELYSIIYHTNACARTRNFSRGNCMHDVGDAREECMWRCAESDCMNARVRNFRAKFCAKFRENRTFRIRTLYRLREIRTLWHTAQDTLVPGPGHYGARHSQRVSGAGSGTVPVI